MTPYNFQTLWVLLGEQHSEELRVLREENRALCLEILELRDSLKEKGVSGGGGVKARNGDPFPLPVGTISLNTALRFNNCSARGFDPVTSAPLTARTGAGAVDVAPQAVFPSKFDMPGPLKLGPMSTLAEQDHRRLAPRHPRPSDGDVSFEAPRREASPDTAGDTDGTTPVVVPEVDASPRIPLLSWHTERVQMHCKSQDEAGHGPRASPRGPRASPRPARPARPAMHERQQQQQQQQPEAELRLASQTMYQVHSESLADPGSARCAMEIPSEAWPTSDTLVAEALTTNGGYMIVGGRGGSLSGSGSGSGGAGSSSRSSTSGADARGAVDADLLNAGLLDKDLLNAGFLDNHGHTLT
eukprot:NODE_12275_length_1235_cov_4.270758.p1 GENE.NODE_12275_length_1235_cov_4.270758~~NODE_12275_length_1235_cov_4.270758.p1  ORF type:complete len:411 (+),score=83.59 NODE_12275_length_1235_cov_4.270758:163-1233(+)